MDYIEKLLEFNATPKYLEEMAFMIDRLNPQSGDKIIDYGCGTGKMVKHINEQFEGVKCFGYDIHNLRSGDDAVDDFTFKSEFHIQMDKVYFMHSFAHIEGLTHLLGELHNKFLEQDGEIHILTPNKRYLDRCKNDNYIPDPTVIKHFYVGELIELFQNMNFCVNELRQIGKKIDCTPERIYIKAIKS